MHPAPLIRTLRTTPTVRHTRHTAKALRTTHGPLFLAQQRRTALHDHRPRHLPLTKQPPLAAPRVAPRLPGGQGAPGGRVRRALLPVGGGAADPRGRAVPRRRAHLDRGPRRRHARSAAAAALGPAVRCAPERHVWREGAKARVGGLSRKVETPCGEGGGGGGRRAGGGGVEGGEGGRAVED